MYNKVKVKTCNVCYGSGTVNGRTCPKCNGAKDIVVVY